MKADDMQSQFFEAYDRLADGLFRYAMLRVYERERARDIVQDSFMKTWEYAASGKHIKNLKAFLYRTALNLIIDHKRRKKSLSLDELMEAGFNPSSGVASMGVSVDALRALESLEPAYRDVLIMRYINDLQVKEIAEVLGEKENTVSVRIKRALERSRVFFNE